MRSRGTSVAELFRGLGVDRRTLYGAFSPRGAPRDHVRDVLQGDELIGLAPVSPA